MPPRKDYSWRPENWKEVTEKLDRGEITQVQASQMLHIHRNKLNELLRYDNPNRRDRRVETAKRMGFTNRKFTTVLEQNFSDYLLCNAIRSAGYCKRCPLGCGGNRKNRGLLKKLLEKTPLKAEEKPLEATDA